LTASNVMNYLQDQAVMNFAGTAARGSAIGTAVSEGMVSYLADSDTIETYNGTSWLRQTSALIPITPSSVVPVGAGSSASSNALGLVTFASCTSLQLAGVFSSRFRNYKVIIDSIKGGQTSSDATYVRLGNATTFVDTNYAGGFNSIESGYTATNNLNSTSQAWLNYHRTIGVNAVYDITISKPFLSENTTFLHYSQGFAPGAAYSYGYGACVHQASTSYSALSLYITGGTFSGTIQVFGYNN